MSQHPSFNRFQFTEDLSICPLLNGMWQVSGGHGKINPKQAVAQMFDYVDAGLTTWDLADHYGPAEDLIGEFRRQLIAQRGAAAWDAVQAFTKWVPRPGEMSRDVVERNVDRALKRMDLDCLDMMQFHWWDYGDRRYLDALGHLADLQTAGKIKHLALTNFDTEHLQTVLDAGIAIASNQVQFSLIDRRPLVKMAPFCEARGVKLLAYGTLGGGLLTARFLHQQEPSRWSLKTASLGKYKQMVDVGYGWQRLQALLQTLATIATKYQVSIANVAVRYVLEQPAVAGAIVGARLSIAEHIAENLRVFEFHLDDEDKRQLEAVLSQGDDLFAVIGDCGDEYRR
jgi:aryl-alcohol dehydrogenase-like predicted oxidoreductase